MKPILFSFLMATVSPIALASGNETSCIDNVTASCQEKASEYWDSGVTSKMRQGNTVYAQCLNDGFEAMLRSQGASDDSIAKIFGLLDEHKVRLQALSRTVLLQRLRLDGLSASRRPCKPSANRSDASRVLV